MNIKAQWQKEQDFASQKYETLVIIDTEQAKVETMFWRGQKEALSEGLKALARLERRRGFAKTNLAGWQEEEASRYADQAENEAYWRGIMRGYRIILGEEDTPCPK